MALSWSTIRVHPLVLYLLVIQSCPVVSKVWLGGFGEHQIEGLGAVCNKFLNTIDKDQVDIHNEEIYTCAWCISRCACQIFVHPKYIDGSIYYVELSMYVTDI